MSQPAMAHPVPGRQHLRQRLAGGGRGNGCQTVLLSIGMGSQEEFLLKKQKREQFEGLGVLMQRLERL